MAAVIGTKSIGGEFRNENKLERVVYDFSVDGGATGALDLFTAGSDVVIKSFHAYVKTACTSGGSATVAVGVTGATSAFITTTTGAVASLTANAVIGAFVVLTEGTPNTAAFPLPRRLASGDKILMTIGTAALTAGKIEFVIEYCAA
jgi:hypothetical protein